MKGCLLLLVVLAIMLLTRCVSVQPVPPAETPLIIVMWCDVDGGYTEWEAQGNYFVCNTSGTIWNPAEKEGLEHDAP